MLSTCKLIDLPKIADHRGNLTVIQWNQHTPFVPKRIFFVHHVPSDKIRGGHAHRVCHQIFVAISGSVKVVIDDAHSRQEIILDNSTRALLVPAGVWATQHAYTSDCVLAVLASHDYDDADYIRDYDAFIEYSQK